jgi:hypothetical protein
MRKKWAQKKLRPFFLPALMVKLVGATVFALIYQFYYGGGDTFEYYNASQHVRRAVFEQPALGAEILFTPAGHFTTENVRYTSRTRYFRSSEEWALSRITTLVGLLAANSYLGISYFFGFFAFLGTWRLYQVFVALYPDFYKPFFVATFLMPSMVFWASGLLKDTVVLGGVGFLTYAAINIFYRRHLLVNGLTAVLVIFLISSLKIYVLYTLVPALLLWYYLKVQGLIRNPILKAAVLPFLLLVVSLLGFLLFRTLANQASEKYSDVDTITTRVQDFHWDHSLRAGGSSYTLGEVTYTPLGILQKAPASINVTLYRPYLWEARNAVVLISAFESFAYLVITIMALFTLSPKRVAKLFGNPEWWLCMVFTLLLGFVVGFVSYNFGALARFKVPLMPFFGIALSLAFYLGKNPSQRNQRKKLKKLEAFASTE